MILAINDTYVGKKTPITMFFCQQDKQYLQQLLDGWDDEILEGGKEMVWTFNYPPGTPEEKEKFMYDLLGVPGNYLEDAKPDVKDPREEIPVGE